MTGPIWRTLLDKSAWHCPYDNNEQFRAEMFINLGSRSPVKPHDHWWQTTQNISYKLVHFIMATGEVKLEAGNHQTL